LDLSQMTPQVYLYIHHKLIIYLLKEIQIWLLMY